MKTYYIQNSIGKCKYVVNFHNGSKCHNDGSHFYDISIFKNKIDLRSFVETLKNKGFYLETRAQRGMK